MLPIQSTFGYAVGDVRCLLFFIITFQCRRREHHDQPPSPTDSSNSSRALGIRLPVSRVTAKDMLTYIALFFEAVRKSTDLADGLTRVFEESKGVLLSGRDANSP